MTRQKRRTQTCTTVLSSAGLSLETMSLTPLTGMIYHLQVCTKETVLYNLLQYEPNSDNFTFPAFAAKELVCRLMEVDQMLRITAQDALWHEW